MHLPISLRPVRTFAIVVAAIMLALLAATVAAPDASATTRSFRPSLQTHDMSAKAARSAIHDDIGGRRGQGG